MRLPNRRIAHWAREIIEECEVSRQARISEAVAWRNYYFGGSSDGTPVSYNRVYPHVDRLSSYLFSPVDPRYALEYERASDDMQRAMGLTVASYLSREFHRCAVDISFGHAVNSALIKNSAFVKLLWGHSGFDPYIVQPEMMGVLREDTNGLDRQEAFFQSMYLTKGQFRRLVAGHPEEEEIIKKVRAQGNKSREGEAESDSYFRQIIIGGTNPVATAPVNNPAGGMVQWVGGPQAMLPPEVARQLIRLDELWVLDDEREDWTTIQLAGDDTVIEGKLQRRNLCGVKGAQPFVQVCANEVPGYFWGRSEIAPIALLQDVITRRLDGIERILRLQERNPKAFIGFSSLTEQVYRTAMARDGFINEENPSGKIQDLTPQLPASAFADLKTLIEFMDEVAGLEQILRGQGQPGVRAGTHAETLVRTASPRLRDRAHLVERQYADLGDFGLRLLQAKNADKFTAQMPGQQPTEFLLDQLPDQFRVVVDSHSSSPVFSEEASQLAFALRRDGAISNADLIRLTHPPYEDTLIAEAEKREQAEAKLMAEHPELAFKGSRRR